MTINDKIKQLLKDKSLSPSHFADEIGVQRSSISHILSGRNRPSFDIIQKIIRRFPELGFDWILEEEESPGSDSPIPAPSIRSETPGPAAFRKNISPVAPAFDQYGEKAALNPYPESSSATRTDKAIERILIFYSDGTFREYLPS